MRHYPTLLAASAACALMIVSVAPTPAAAVPGARTARLKPLVIAESFTPLPCSGRRSTRTTTQMEGCAEHRVLRGDATINALSAKVFARLHSNAARRRFIAAQRAWARYRRADCMSFSDAFQGGTQTPVAYLQCVASRNTQRRRNLKGFLRELG